MNPADKEMFESLGMPQGITATALLVSWANGQDAWIRHLTSEVIMTGSPFSPGQMDAIYQTFLMEKALVAGDPAPVPMLTDASSLADSGSSLALVRLSAYSGDDDRLFRPKVTGHSAGAALGWFITLFGHDPSTSMSAFRSLFDSPVSRGRPAGESDRLPEGERAEALGDR